MEAKETDQTLRLADHLTKKELDEWAAWCEFTLDMEFNSAIDLANAPDGSPDSSLAWQLHGRYVLFDMYLENKLSTAIRRIAEEPEQVGRELWDSLNEKMNEELPA